MTGSANEPVASPDQAAAQMQAATERLRHKAWMVAPMTSASTSAAESSPDPDRDG